MATLVLLRQHHLLVVDVLLLAHALTHQLLSERCQLLKIFLHLVIESLDLTNLQHHNILTIHEKV